jgi:putative methyltransferase
MNNIYLLELSDDFVGQIKLPYSTGLIWSYCLESKTIKNNFKLSKWFFGREKEKDILNDIKNPNVIGISNFVWNSMANYRIAKTIKEKYPECLIVFGGQASPNADRIGNFFKKHPYVDIIVHGEGEIVFKNILLEKLNGGNYSIIKGITYNTKKEYISTQTEDRIKDISEMPSPYLNGLFDNLMENKADDFVFEATIETTRGCPYSCTFCEIGSKYFTKLSKMENQKVFKELDWISKNKIEFFYNADSNFGLFPEHLEYTKYAVNLKKKNGYPKTFRTDWAKSKADKVIELAKLFTDADMDKGMTMALQSMNSKTLKAIKRKNIDNGKLSEFIKLYDKENIPYYVELILGLPEETFKSFTNGIHKLMELGMHNYIGIYPMTALPNTPFYEKEYIKEHGLNIVKTTPAFYHHSNPERLLLEDEKMVVGSNTMSVEEYTEASLYRWMVMFGHYLNHTQYISKFLKSKHNISYGEFYNKFYSYIKTSNGILNKEYRETKESLYRIFNKEQCWGRTVDEVKKDYYWDFEEATSLNILLSKDEYWKELYQFLISNFDEDIIVIFDIIKFQKFSKTNPFEKYPIVEDFNYNIYDVVFNGNKLKNSGYLYKFDSKSFNNDIFRFAIENLWWGRRNGGAHTNIEQIYT